MTDVERRILSCIDHINTAVDVDPWAKELVAEMGKEALKKLNNSKEDAISRQAAIDCVTTGAKPTTIRGRIAGLPSVQPQYEELTPEEAASEIASGSIMSASYWLDLMIRLKQMGYAICRKENR